MFELWGFEVFDIFEVYCFGSQRFGGLQSGCHGFGSTLAGLAFKV